MTLHDFSRFENAVAERRRRVREYISANTIPVTHPHLEEAVSSYLNAGGKALRAAVMQFCCGLVGGDERTTLPAAAAVELYHAFTLVHDDIIDQDDMRRGVPTIHKAFYDRVRGAPGYNDDEARHYGLAVGILAGDVQQGWAASILTHLYSVFGCSPELALNLIHELFWRVQSLLMEGEVCDVELAKMPIDAVTETAVLEMLKKKTGVLYEFAGRAGAAIGLKEPNLLHPQVAQVAAFTGQCGVAFQIQDDILGLTASAQKLGKPIGSDIREGKRTLIVLHSLPKMTAAEREETLAVLGNPHADKAQIETVVELLRTRGGIAYAQAQARRRIQDALAHIAGLPDSEYKTLLITWAHYMTEREF